MPSTDKTFATFTPGNSFFSSFDLTKGYWQIEIAEEDRHKTSFFWNGQNYQFKRLPFGMTCSGNTFSRELYEVFRSCNFSAENVLFYLDDITVFAKTWDEFMKNHKLFFEAIIKNGLKLNPEKCLVLKSEVPFLGRIIGKEGMKPDPVTWRLSMKYCHLELGNNFKHYVVVWCGYLTSYLLSYTNLSSPQVLQLLCSQFMPYYATKAKA